MNTTLHVHRWTMKVIMRRYYVKRRVVKEIHAIKILGKHYLNLFFMTTHGVWICAFTAYLFSSIKSSAECTVTSSAIVMV